MFNFGRFFCVGVRESKKSWSGLYPSEVECLTVEQPAFGNAALCVVLRLILAGENYLGKSKPTFFSSIERALVNELTTLLLSSRNLKFRTVRGSINLVLLFIADFWKGLVSIVLSFSITLPFKNWTSYRFFTMVVFFLIWFFFHVMYSCCYCSYYFFLNAISYLGTLGLKSSVNV